MFYFIATKYLHILYIYVFSSIIFWFIELYGVGLYHGLFKEQLAKFG